jgi:2-C-methyl-D-erythritol 4-phosphate cytidylyltransferase
VALSSVDGEVWTIVVAGGSGTRFGQAKQYERIGEHRLVDLAVGAASRCCHGVVLVVPESDVARERGSAASVVAGGPTRSASVRAGLGAVPSHAQFVLVHDAARPFADDELFGRVLSALRDGAEAAVPAVPVTDTVKRVANGVVVETPDRESLVAVQTPQGFRADVLRSAHESGAESTDDAALVEACGGRVVVVAGDARNRKITHPEDLEWARSLAVGAG